MGGRNEGRNQTGKLQEEDVHYPARRFASLLPDSQNQDVGIGCVVGQFWKPYAGPGCTAVSSQRPVNY
jgi:hypothetical protein